MSFKKCVGGGPYVYAAFSHQLNLWALENDTPFWFKIGISAYGKSDRIASLNKPNFDKKSRTKGRPCLNLTDWTGVDCWNAPDASVTENRVQKFCERRFGRPLDWKRLVNAERPTNGETEIYFFPLAEIPRLSEIMREAKTNYPLTGEIIQAVFQHIRFVIEQELLPSLATPEKGQLGDGPAPVMDDEEQHASDSKSEDEPDLTNISDDEFEHQEEPDLDLDDDEIEFERRTFEEELEGEIESRVRLAEENTDRNWLYPDED